MQRPSVLSSSTSSGTITNGATNNNGSHNGPLLTPSSSTVGSPSINRRRGTTKKSKLSRPSTKQHSIMLIAMIFAASVAVIVLSLVVIFAAMRGVHPNNSHSNNNNDINNAEIPSRYKLKDAIGAGIPNLLRGNLLLKGETTKLASDKARIALAFQQDTKELKEYPYPLQAVDTSYDIAANFQVLGEKRYSEYTTGTSPYRIDPDLISKSDDVARSRRYHVREAMKFAWDGYVSHAFGQDEILPQTGGGSNSWGGHAITLVDALDTLWLMNMKDEFYQARDWVRDHLDFSKVGPVSVFETTIRDLGGLLAAYDWSNDIAFLNKAVDIGERLLRAFDHSVTGLPFGQVSLKDGASSNIGWTGGNVILSEFGTLQIEFRHLAKATGRPEFATKVEKIFEIMNDISPPDGLYPYYYRSTRNEEDTKPIAANDKITFGAMSDSFYEYMLKVWIQGGKSEPMYRKMYDKAMDGMHDSLVRTSQPSGLTYIGDKNEGKFAPKMDHLVCFMGGLLALGAYTDPSGLDSPRAMRDLRTGKALTYTCYQMYARMNTGISPEFVEFEGPSDFRIGRGAPHYLLRPEAVESMFILNQLTGDPVYREWGWEIFQAIEKYCKTRFAYGALSNVQDTHGKPRDKMESFFLAETLKYLYLLQDPDTEIDILHKHVFNTEAHPLRIFPELDAVTANA